MTLESVQGTIFRKYAPAIAREYEMSLEDEDDYQDSFDAMAISFRKVCDVANMGRWLPGIFAQHSN